MAVNNNLFEHVHEKAHATPQAQEVEALDAQDEADKSHDDLSTVPQCSFALVTFFH